MSPGIVEMAIKSSVIIVVAATAAGVMRRRGSAASRHFVWMLAVVSLLVLPAAVVVLPSWNIPIRRQIPALSVGPAAPMAIESEAIAAVDAAARNDAPLPRPVPVPVSFGAILATAYVAGVAFLLARLVVELWRTRRILSRATTVIGLEWTQLSNECGAHLGIHRDVRLMRSREEVMPMTGGVRKPAIVIPAVADTWDADRRRAVILHELAHVVRFDCLTQALAEAAVALYWPHPGVWWAARRLHVERELACDDRVLSSGTEPREYASHLLEIAHSLGRYRAPALAVGMARPRQLEARMIAMLDPARNRTIPAANRRLLALALSVVVVAPLAAVSLASVPVTLNAPGMPSSSAALPGGGAPVALAQNPASQMTALSGGTWQIRLASDGRSAHLTVSVVPNSTYGTTIPLDSVEGLGAILTGPGGPASYTLKRDAGSFDFEGVVRAGAGGGTFSFTPNAGFADELVRRGFSRPTAFDLGTLAWSDIGFAFLDELNALKYARPTLQQLVNGAQHGVTRRYLREMADLGYRVGTIDALVRLRDHGVDALFVRGMQGQGMKGLSVDELVRSRDHGVDPQFIQGLRALGYDLNMDQLVDARNHGIEPGYVQNLRALGLSGLSLEELVNARNHGVDPGYVSELRALGYQLRLDELVDARNHGVDPGFIREMAWAGYQHPSIADLIRMLNHGVNAKTVERLKSRGYDHPSIDRLIELQSRGASAAPATRGPSLYASRSMHRSLKVVGRDISVAVQQWADRWLK